MRRRVDLPQKRVRQLVPVGFWRSAEQPDLPHPRDFVDLDWDPTERARVIRYLGSAYSLIHYRGYSRCRFGCSGPNGSQTHTDGTFMFPEGLVHYLAEHSVRPDEAFLEHLRTRRFRMPALHLRAVALWARAMRLLGRS